MGNFRSAWFCFRYCFPCIFFFCAFAWMFLRVHWRPWIFFIQFSLGTSPPSPTLVLPPPPAPHLASTMTFLMANGPSLKTPRSYTRAFNCILHRMCSKLKHIHYFSIYKRMQFSGLSWIFFYCSFKILKYERINLSWYFLRFGFFSFVLLVTTTVHQTVISIEHLATGYCRLSFVFLGSKNFVNRFSTHKILSFS